MKLRSLVCFLVALAFPALLTAQPPQSADTPSATQGRVMQRLLQAPEPNTDLVELLASVSARAGVEFLVDPRIPQLIYVSQGDVDEMTYPQLLSVLRINGHASVYVDGRINIVPNAVARSLVTQIVQRDDPDIPDDLWVTRIIEVRDSEPSADGPGRAGTLVPVLRPLLPQTAHFAAWPDSGSLIIVDRYANVRRITEMVELLTR